MDLRLRSFLLWHFISSSLWFFPSILLLFLFFSIFSIHGIYFLVSLFLSLYLLPLSYSYWFTILQVSLVCVAAPNTANKYSYQWLLSRLQLEFLSLCDFCFIINTQSHGNYMMVLMYTFTHQSRWNQQLNHSKSIVMIWYFIKVILFGMKTGIDALGGRLLYITGGSTQANEACAALPPIKVQLTIQHRYNSYHSDASKGTVQLDKYWKLL